MDISLRSALTAGVAGISASVIALSPSLTPLPQYSMSQASSTVASHATVDLRAVTLPLFPPAPTTAQLLEALESLRAAAVTPGIVTTPGLINLANAIDAAYLAIEPWVAYAFEVVSYVLGWIPYGWIIDDQIFVIYNFVESLIHSGVFNTTDWLRGEGSALKNIADWIVDAGLSLVWLGLDELSAWVPLPPLPAYPPRAPWADLPEGFLGNAVVELSAAIATVSHAIWNVWEPIKAAIDSGVEFTSDFLDTIAWVPFVPLINFELTETWELIYRGVDAVTGFAHDMISAGDQFVIDTVDGEGLITATVNAFNSSLDSIAARGGEAIQTWVDWGRDQIDYLVDLLTPGSAGTLAALQRQTAAAEVGITLSSTAFGPTLAGTTSIDSTEHADSAKVASPDGATATSDGDVAQGGELDAAKAETDAPTSGENVSLEEDLTAVDVTPVDVPAAADSSAHGAADGAAGNLDVSDHQAGTSDEDGADDQQKSSSGHEPDNADKPAADDRKVSEVEKSDSAGGLKTADDAKVAVKTEGRARHKAKQTDTEKSDRENHGERGSAPAGHAKDAGTR
jgi:hypothetical protein